MCKKILTALLTTLASTVACADNTGAPVWNLTFALGRGVLENPLTDHEDGETSFLPSFSYYGDRFFISNLTAGYALLEEKRFYLDLVARPNEDGLYYKVGNSDVPSGAFVSILTHAGAPGLTAPDVGDIDRDVSIVAGPSATLVTDYVDVSFSWFHDVTHVHDGSETHLSLDKQYPLLGGAVGVSLGAINKDADLVNYYYHFTETEAGAFAGRYKARYPVDDVTDQYARLHFSYPLGKGLEFRLAARYDKFDLEGRNERFIDKPETLNWFVGLQYTIGGGQ